MNKRGDACRLCLVRGFFHINLFTTTHNVVEAIQEIFHCEVTKLDNLPNYVCVDCWLTVKKFHEFYRNVVTVQNRFLNVENNPTIKVEPIHEELEDNISYNGDSHFEDFDELDDRDEHHENVVIYENFKSDIHSDNDESNFDTNNFANDDDSDQVYQEDKEVKYQDDSSDSSEFNIDMSEDYTPRKSYERNNLTAMERPRRKRGRPKKIRTKEELEAMNLKRRKIFKCPHCVKAFTRRCSVQVHIRLLHGFECSICNLKLPSEQKLKLHLNIHEDGFDIKLRQKLDEISAIDANDVNADERDAIWRNFDLKCDECPVVFESLNEAQVHYLNVHNNGKGYIKCCDVKFREEHIIKEHIAYHKNPSLYTCFVCGTTVKIKSYFRTHMKSHIVDLLEDQKHVCDICDQHFGAKSNLMYHKAEAHSKVKFKCDLCAKTLYTLEQKEKHLRNAHETMSQTMIDYVLNHFDMSCDICDMMFESFPHAKRHYLIDHGEQKGYLKCCNQKLKSLAAIDDHVRYHENPESLKCPTCGKVFKMKDQYKTHIRRHGKTFTCEICGKSFKRHTTLVGHRKAVHESGPRDFHCHFCSLRFLTEEKREKHEQLIHYGNTTGARIVCDICGKGFHQTSHLLKHIQSHHSGNEDKKAKKEENKSEMCTICGLWLSSRYRLKLHRKCHSMEPNRCQEHASSHAVEKLYRCGYCLESFVWRATLDAHIKKEHPYEHDGDKNTENVADSKPHQI